MNGWVAQMPTIVLTDHALIIVKDRLFGKPKANRMVALEEIAATGCGPLLDVGPTWEVVFKTRGHATASMYFSGPVVAEQVHKVLQAALLSVTDPELRVATAEFTILFHG